jgi:hypothetical protein
MKCSPCATAAIARAGRAEGSALRRVALAALTALACEARAPVTAEPGPDCAALLAVAERAQGCDPRLGLLMTELRSAPDELRCRGAARGLLAPPPLARGRVVSVYEQPPAPDPTPLTAAEHAALAELPLPGTLTLIPDLAPGPGVPGTSATLGEVELAREAGGRLSGTWAPGQHLLRVRHADRETTACVTLRACEAVTVTAHGASLAPHPAVRPGPCERP